MATPLDNNINFPASIQYIALKVLPLQDFCGAVQNVYATAVEKALLEYNPYHSLVDRNVTYTCTVTMDTSVDDISWGL